MNDPKLIAARLAEIAKERGISQKAISETSCIRETTISRILTGKFAANSAYLCRIADAVGVRIVFDCDCG
jgi:transcriptional regulator with XRE-family HTH domain